MDEERSHSAENLAFDVLNLARNTLMLNFRFLDRALSRLTLTVTETPWFASDGRKLYFEPWFILGQYKAEQTIINRDYLHTVLHCVFRHGFVGKNIDIPRWDLSCDIAVENMLTGLDSPCLAAHRVRAQIPVIETIRSDVPELSAERIYSWLADKNISEQEMREIRLNFLGDEHGIWYGACADPNAEKADVDVELIWQEVSKSMQTELETLSRDKGAALVQSLKTLNRAKHDYTDFLRRFGVWGEAMKISDEEFDNNYYSYGLELYGNMPLIEPLEYREQKRIRDFVIAIDTSGSVRGEVVQSFIQHTHDILCRQDSFFTKVNMRIIQCDDEVRDDARITCREDFERYIAGLEIKGLGRTDFRPVFAHVDELLKNGELYDLRGLIYFTDGRGIFPSKKPAYDTAFILRCDGYSEPAIPTWAMKLTLTDGEILDKKFGSR